MGHIRNAAAVAIPGTLAAAILAANAPAQRDYDPYLALFFVALVGLLFNLGAALKEGWISPAPTAVLMAYLTLGQDGNAPAALWSVALGSFVGVVVWLLRAPWMPRLRRYTEHIIRNVIASITQMTLGVYCGGWFYDALGGRLPLDRLDNADMLPLAALAMVFWAVHLGLLVVQAPAKTLGGSSIGDQPWQTLFGIILLPLPFAALGAVAYHALSPLAFGLTIAGLLGAVAGVFVISQSQARYRQQVLELSSLSAVSQAMHANLDLTTLLDVIYRQLHELLNVNNYTVALYDSNRDMLFFPYNVVGGRPAQLPPREVQHGPIEYVIHERKPLLLVDNVPRRARAMGLTPPSVSAYSWLGVPLLAPDRVLGCMVIYSTSPLQRFSPDDLHLLTLLAAQAEIAIDNSSLYGQARSRSKQLAMLNNVASILGGSLDLRQILDFVKSSAEAVAGCDAVAVYVWWDDARRTLTLARQSGLSEAFAVDPPEPLLATLDGGARRQPVIVTNSQVDRRVGRLRPRLDRERKRAWVELLLAKGEELLGILALYYDEPRQFAPEEIELFRNFANLAALAISNARLYTRTDEALHRRVEQLSTLAVVSRDLASTLSLEAIYQLVLDRAMEATESAAGALFLLADEELRPVAQRGLDPDALRRIGAGESLAQLVLAGDPLVIPDIAHQAGDLALNDRMRSHLAVPVMRGNAVLGAIVLGSERIGEYNQDDVSFVSQLAAQAHIAIDNVRLFHHIQEARDRLVIILDSMREALILLDASGRITLTNPRVEPLLGLDPEVIGQQPVIDLLSDSELALAQRLGFSPDALVGIVQGLAAGEWDPGVQIADRVTYEIAAPRRRFIDRTDAAVRDRSGRVVGLLMVFTDVTEEHNLAQARQELTSMIVHDLRGPLTAVMTSLKLLSDAAPPDEPVGRVIEQTTGMASRAVRKMLSLVDSLLDISKMESGTIALEYEPVDLREPCATVLDDLEPLAQELNIRLSTDIPPDMPLLKADLEKTERILLNLVDNALKYTPTGGRIVIRAYAPGAQGAAEGFVRIDVADTGPGVPDEHKERLFDRFAQLDGPRGRRRGTGLGLTFCRMAVEAHGGRIWIEDNPHGGAVFAFTLPVAALDEWTLADEDW